MGIIQCPSVDIPQCRNSTASYIINKTRFKTILLTDDKNGMETSVAILLKSKRKWSIKTRNLSLQRGVGEGDPMSTL